MKINVEKTKVMTLEVTTLELEGQEQEQVTECMYHGSHMTGTATSEREVITE